MKGVDHVNAYEHEAELAVVTKGNFGTDAR